MQLAAAELANSHVTLVPFDVDRDGAELRAMAEQLGERIATWPYYAPAADWIGYWLVHRIRRDRPLAELALLTGKPLWDELVAEMKRFAAEGPPATDLIPQR